MKKTNLLIAFALAAVAGPAVAQVTPQETPDVSNKALITNAPSHLAGANPPKSCTLHKLADAFYAWRNEQYPVRSSDSGLHTWDDRLTDYSPAKIAGRAQHVRALSRAEMLQRAAIRLARRGWQCKPPSK